MDVSCRFPNILFVYIFSKFCENLPKTAAVAGFSKVSGTSFLARFFFISSYSKTALTAEPFLSSLQKVSFCQASNIFCMLAVFFCILKNYSMQKIMSVVIGVYKFGQKFFIIGIFEGRDSAV